jgi:hypothetical protein
MSHHTTSLWAGRSISTVAVAVAAVLALAACTAPAQTPTGIDGADDAAIASDNLLKDYGLAGLDAREIVDLLDSMPISERPDDLMVSIRPDDLIVTDAAQQEVTLPMPDEEFYVSIAPYVDETHDCYFHSLTTCAGEIQNADVHLLATDSSSGEILIDETLTTFDNGFVGLWLPRDIDVTVSIEYDGRSATSDLSTRSDDDATCVTTMQLA